MLTRRQARRLASLALANLPPLPPLPTAHHDSGEVRLEEHDPTGITEDAIAELVVFGAVEGEEEWNEEELAVEEEWLAFRPEEDPQPANETPSPSTSPSHPAPSPTHTPSPSCCSATSSSSSSSTSPSPPAPSTSAHATPTTTTPLPPAPLDPTLSSDKRRHLKRAEKCAQSKDEQSSKKKEKNKKRRLETVRERAVRWGVLLGRGVGVKHLPVSTARWAGVRKRGDRVRVEDLEKVHWSGEQARTGVTSGGETLFALSADPSEETLLQLERLLSAARRYRRATNFEMNHASRGRHRNIIWGLQRNYRPFLTWTSAHSRGKRSREADIFMGDEGVRELSAFATRLVQTHFPRVYERYKNASEADPSQPFPFGIFSLLCVNFADGGSVQTERHCDFKNPAGGVCVVMPYGDFDDKTKHWLVLEELGLVVQVPAGAAIAFPSSLITHYNVNIVEGETEEAVRKGKGKVRGSVVWFTQADVISLRELGCTVAAAKARGMKAEWGGLHEIFKRN